MTIRSYDIITPDPDLDPEVFLRQQYIEALKRSTEIPGKLGAVALWLVVTPNSDGNELAARRHEQDGSAETIMLNATMVLDSTGFDESSIRATGDVTVGTEKAVCGWGRLEKDENDQLKLHVNEELANLEEPGEAAMEFNF
ncbi:hypothetical protein GWK76_00230 [Candidatus Saccharibacteria bacterium oral taxon 488]|jgi:hypothetical protein|nr:hypothetical protein GWK76_00230 [Candidatus Saccharibacteria bacterium oral taxon 488]